MRRDPPERGHSLISPSIGIGITTRNRPYILSVALRHFAYFSPPNARYVIVEDSATDLADPIVRSFARQSASEVIWRRSTKRLGIAKAKNACLAALTDCDHVFLFDDDAFAQVDGWAERWIAAAERHDVEHSMYIHPSPSDSLFKLKDTLGEGDTAMHSWSNCMGVALHFTRECLSALGGYDSSAQAFYGFEHAQMSSRAHKAGLTRNHDYLSPAIVGKLIYSVDLSHGFHREPTPLPSSFEGFKSSTSPEDVAICGRNSKLMNNPPVYIPLSDPTGLTTELL